MAGGEAASSLLARSGTCLCKQARLWTRQACLQGYTPTARLHLLMVPDSTTSWEQAFKHSSLWGRVRMLSQSQQSMVPRRLLSSSRRQSSDLQRACLWRTPTIFLSLFFQSTIVSFFLSSYNINLRTKEIYAWTLWYLF